MTWCFDLLQAFRIRRPAEASFASAKVFWHPADRDQVSQLCQLLRSQPKQCSVGDLAETHSHPQDHQVGQLTCLSLIKQKKDKVQPCNTCSSNNKHVLPQRGWSWDSTWRQPKSGAAKAVWGASEESESTQQLHKVCPDQQIQNWCQQIQNL